MTIIDDEQLRPIIIDIGTDKSKIGWAGTDYPEIMMPSIYVDMADFIFNTDVIEGLDDILIPANSEKYLYGDDALKYQNILKIHEFKKENNFNIIYRFILHYYHQLNISPENQFKQPVIILLPFFTPEIEKIRLQKLFFDFFKFPKILFLQDDQAILASLQKTSGVILNIGESNTYISSIFHGFTNIMARDIFPISGKDLTNYMLNLIITGKGKTAFIDKWIAKELKEKTSLCIKDTENEKKRIKEGLSKYNRTINLPDGGSLILNYERFLVSEPFFDPRALHIDHIGIDEVIAKVIKSWDRENWEELVPNIILAGGGSLIPGFDEKLKTKIASHFSEKLQGKVNIIAVNGREYMNWIGASILYSKDQLSKKWIQNPNVEHEPVIEESQPIEPKEPME